MIGGNVTEFVRGWLVNASRIKCVHYVANSDNIFTKILGSQKGGSSKQNSRPMTDYSRYNCYAGESREGNVK